MEKRKQSSKVAGDKRQEKKQRGRTKDPNQPKRPPSAFFVFMEDFRKSYKKLHPNEKSVAVVGKAGGNKWKSMTEQEKGPFMSEASKRKEAYEEEMAAYKNQDLGGQKAEEANGGGDSEDEDDLEEE